MLARATIADSSSAEIETITPMRAQEYIDRSGSNRAITRRRVSIYAEMMKEGKWRLNGEAILFDTEGLLMNGQHRLLACIEANTAFRTYVIRGISREVMPSLDTGRARTAGDNVSILGGGNSTLVAASIIWILKMKSGRVLNGNLCIPHEDTLNFWRNNSEAITYSVGVGRSARQVLQGSIACGFHFIFSELDREMADRFMEDVATGANLSKGDAVFILREQLLQNKMVKQKLPPVEIAARVVRAWSHRRTGTTTKLLRGTYGTGSSRLFPELV